MSVLNQLQQASFKGFTFLVPRESLSSRKKIAVHNYPNSDERYIEELGSTPEDFSITAIIHGVDAIQQRINFARVLNEAGAGLLIHPSLGQIEVIATDFNSSSSDTEIGKFQFDISFKRSSGVISLNPELANAQAVSAIAQESARSLDESFIDQYINSSFIEVIRVVATQSGDLADNVQVLVQNIENAISVAVESVEVVIENLKSRGQIIVMDGEDYVSNLRSMYDGMLSVVPSPDGLLPTWLGNLFFGSDRNPKSLITAQRIEEENNLSAVEEHSRINSLIYAFEAAAYATYETDEEVREVRDRLNEAYDDIVNESPAGSIVYTPDLRSNLQDLRNATRLSLDEAIANSWRVVDVAPNGSSLSLMTYRFYGDLELVDVIGNLNPDVNAAIIDADMMKAVST